MVTTEINSPAANRWGASRPGSLIRIRCRETSATSSLITDRAKTSHASQPTIVISPTRIMPSTGVNRARRRALQVSSSGSGLPPRKAKGDRNAGNTKQQDSK